MVNPVQQSGQVTPQHIALWVTDGVIQDGGSILAALAITTFVTTIQSGSSYDAQPNDQRILVNKTIGSVTAILLPLGVNKNGPVLVKDLKGDAATNPITVTFTGNEQADGLGTVTINVNYGAYWFNPLTGGYYLTVA